MRSALIVLAVSVGVVVCPTAPATAEPPTMPDLRATANPSFGVPRICQALRFNLCVTGRFGPFRR
jgi:hypothetical protein